MKNIILVIIAISAFMFSCETDQDFIDTGLPETYYDMSMMDLMKKDSYNWDSTILVIQRAGLEDLFEGKDPDYPQFTFLGFTNLSILRYLLNEPLLDEDGNEQYDEDYNVITCRKIDDISAETWRELVLKHVLPEKIMFEDVPFGIHTTGEEGGQYETLGDEPSLLWMCRYTSPLNGVPNAGPTLLYLQSVTAEATIEIASSNIECNNGVIHSLHYNYVFGKI